MLIEVSEPSQTGEARRKAAAFAEELQLTEEQCGEVALVATEMATNLIKHAGRGHILMQSIQRNGHSGLRMMSVDKGPGIANIARALTDGPVAAGSLGSGLGAIRRVPDYFDLYSVPGAGTVISAEFWRGANEHAQERAIKIGVVSEPIPGEEISGDGWGARYLSRGVLLMVVDGLGHGLGASEAARETEALFAAAATVSAKDILLDSHDALRKTRGAAVAVAHLDLEKNVVTFAGVGNISTSIVSPAGSRSLPSHNGIVGQQMQRVQEFSCPWSSDSMLVMHSDGLTSRWDIERYNGIWSKPPSVVAAVLHRDFNRGRDDVTVLVAKST